MSEPGLEDLVAAIDANVAASAQTFSVDAAPSAPAVEDRHVVFSLAGLRCAAPIQNVMEIDKLPRLTPVPHAPGWLLGVTNLRGEIVSIVDLRSFLELEGPASDETRRILVARDNGAEIKAALIVDRVEGLAHLPPEAIEPPRSMLQQGVAPYVRGFYGKAERLLAVLDLEKLLLSEAFRQFE